MFKISSILLSLLSVILLASCSNRSKLTTPFSVNENDQGIELLEDGQSVFFYQREPKSLDGQYSRNNYIHPLYDLDGDILTEDFPKDHLHHRGIFWAWHQIYVGDSLISDSWALDNFENIIKDVKTELNNNSARINIIADWTSPIFQNNKPYLEEKTQITVHKKKDSLRIIDLRIELSALVENIKLGGSNDDKGYGGFSLRIKMPDNLRFTAEDGDIVPQTLQINAGPWMDFSASFGASKKISGITLLCHPYDPNYPQPWIIRQKGSMQNIVFPGRNAIDIPKNKPVILQYRLVLHNGSAFKSDIEKWNSEYSTDLSIK
ncbi:hypothetical protein MNBD_IGNAVI01-315 [hydrothermal vent metagenome]|uniref:Methane oxygenase PmoA n=1 Tax=hydrothermal vent metagenome TaxID=652676 RepID=A0A3B1CEQ6_9ZZZZ